MMKLILGSKSPRRKEILEMAQIPFRVLVSDTDENVSEADPSKKVQAIAKKKAQAIIDELDKTRQLDNETVVLCADTIVVTKDNQVLEKPKDVNDARRMIETISDTYHYVYTAYVIKSNQKEIIGLEKTLVYVNQLSQEEIEEYIHMKEPYDKAGAYAIQGFFGKYISKIDGDFYNVMGLPLCKINSLLKEFN